MEENFDRSEKLHRYVITNPDYWKTAEGRPSSAVFKDSNGVSVDRDGGRNDDEIITTFKNRFGQENIRAIVCVNAGYCIDIGAHLVYSPEPDNVYHSLILESPERITLKPSKAKNLAKNCSVVYLNEF